MAHSKCSRKIYSLTVAARVLSIWWWFGKFKISNRDGREGRLLKFSSASHFAQNKTAHPYVELQSPVSSLNPSPILLHAYFAPVTSWSSNMPGIFPPRDLCSCCSLCLECSFLEICTDYSFTSFRSLLRCHLLSEVSYHPIWNKIAHPPPPSDTPYIYFTPYTNFLSF